MHNGLKPVFLLVTILALFISCDKPIKKPPIKKAAAKAVTVKKEADTAENYMDKVLKTIPKNIKPVLGYRFIVDGDFDGDGKKEKLTEHYFSGLTNKETNKYYDNLPEYDQLVALTMKKEPYSFMLSDNKTIDTLDIAAGAQLFGIAYLKNEGDLNGDGTDEVSYVIDWADWSSLNTWHIVTYKDRKWQEIYTFEIWDWQLPNLPEAFNGYGLFGVEERITIPVYDTMNIRLEKELKEFKGLVKKIKTNKIQVTYRTDEAEEETMIVNLRKLKKK